MLESNIYFFLISLQVLNRKVIFNAQITQGENDIIGNLTFDHVSINIGGGFDGSIAGVFKVPVSGNYQMSFSGSSATNTEVLSQILIYNNDSEILRICDSNELHYYGNNLSYTWVMKLAKGDELRLSSENYLHATSTSPITFTGELIYVEN